MVQGIVKWFDSKKGFGFIRTQGIAKDIFLHYSKLQMEGFKTVEDGERVEFDLVEGVRGLEAHNVKPVDF